MFSMLDVFLGYNKILVTKEDQYNMVFTTLWANFAYQRMSFGLMNAGMTFQRAMEFNFRYFIGKRLFT